MILGQIIYLWLIITLLGFLTFPLIFFISPRLKDRGYSISKILGLVLVTYLSWILSRLNLLPFSTGSVVLATLLIAVVSGWVGWKRKSEIFSFLKENRNLILGIELLFIIALGFFLLIISLNPNIDPDSERFMDYALLNSIDRTDYFPPLDPWFAGKSMNYYYYGYIIVATLHKLVDIPLPIFFNLALGLIYALFVLTCFGTGYNLTGKRSYGILAVIIIIFIGNLDGFIQIVSGKYQGFDFFHSARVLIQEAPDGRILDYPINEFPFFSLMWGDLHAYVIAFPVNMCILNLLLNLALSPFRGWKCLGETKAGRILYLVILSLALGALFGTNTWDYPIYLAVTALVLFFNYFKTAELELLKEAWEKADVFWKKLLLFFLPMAVVGWKEGLILLKKRSNLILTVLTIFIISFLIYSPFNLDFIREQAGGGRGGIGRVSLRSPLDLFLVAFGIYLFFLAAFLICKIYRPADPDRKKTSWAPLVLFIIASLVIIITSGPSNLLLPTYIFLIILGSPVLFLLLFSFRKEGEYFSAILAVSALGLAIICEFFFLKDHYLGGGYERMNTVFKIYIHVWLFLGVASVYFINYINQLLKDRDGLRIFWQTLVFGSLFLGLFYPLGALGARIRGNKQPLTLDGTAYISRPVPDHQKKEWRWDPDDWKAIKWIEKNISGRPIILEATGNAYDWASRISTFTGLPTLVGWVNHEAGWRNDWTEPGRRNQDTQKIYSTTDLNSARRLIRKYNIEYIYLGKLERENYPEAGLKKFSRLGELVYREGPVEIYWVGR